MKHATPSVVRRGAYALVSLLALAALPQSAGAHSLAELETQLSGRDKYFQPVDQSAPDFTLVDANGREVSLVDFGGKVVVLNFIYTTCGDVCPLHSQVIAQLQSMTNISPMKDQTVFVSVTTDPSHDQGSILTEYGEAQGLDPANWIFLTSSATAPADTTRKVAKAYGLEFTEVDGMQMHGLVTHVIDREGKLRGRFHGLNFEATSLVTFANALANDVHKPGEDKSPEDVWSWFTKLFGGQQ